MSITVTVAPTVRQPVALTRMFLFIAALEQVVNEDVFVIMDSCEIWTRMALVFPLLNVVSDIVSWCQLLSFNHYSFYSTKVWP